MKVFPPVAALALAFAALAGCATSPPTPGLHRLEEGKSVEFDGRLYMLDRVEEDYVVRRYREPGEGRIISGFVEEVFRVSRYDLGQGRWHAGGKLPGAYLQWLGLDSFALVHEPAGYVPSGTVMAK
jgi:hypothetical protein